MAPQTYFVETWGCQMNVLDSQRLEGILQQRGLAPASTAAQADLVLLNTCSVREKAVQKVLSLLGELHHAPKTSGAPRIVGLCGCVAEQEGARLLRRSLGLNFVLGPGRVSQLGSALDAVAAGENVSLTGFSATHDYDAHLIARGPGARQYVTIIHGCSQHCTFCIVPYTRGHEASRPLADVVSEVRQIVAAGGREVTLLGQTVNAYRCPTSGADLGDLLGAVGAIDGLWRVQFLTSHPKLFTDSMIARIAAVPNLDKCLHVPFQSGSDRILKRMHRGHTREQYLALVHRLHSAIPDLTLSTDAIVGFPDETEDDFADTLSLVEEVGFGQLYGFLFSARPRTPASQYGNRVPHAVASERLERLFAAQSGIQLDLNRRWVGRRVEVLVDGPAKRGSELWQGRGDDRRAVNFPGWDGIRAGELATLEITGATSHALLGERVQAGLPVWMSANHRRA
ncbi:MAG: tRNA (N6-isopentenyl adenosine(37)-C2)-methylthiotransferase MiaB [Thermoanaerobaculales bacterium]